MLKGQQKGLPIEARFWPKVLKTDSCWVWQGSMAGECGGIRYGSIAESAPSRKMLAAHRVSWEMHNGTIPAGLFVLHKCDNPPCVRPDHLFLGTLKDNSSDRVSKGRTTLTSMQARTRKLEPSEVLEIRSSSLPPKDLAVKYSVSSSTILNVIQRHTWRSL